MENIKSIEYNEILSLVEQKANRFGKLIMQIEFAVKSKLKRV